VATLHIRGVPEDVYRALAERARERETSLTAETIRLLRKALALDRPGQAALIESILQDRRPMPPGAPSAARLIREDRRR
jgi:plasmid stability protein